MDGLILLLLGEKLRFEGSNWEQIVYVEEGGGWICLDEEEWVFVSVGVGSKDERDVFNFEGGGRMVDFDAVLLVKHIAKDLLFFI